MININDLNQGDLIRDFTEAWLKASAISIGEDFAAQLLANKPRWHAGYDPKRDEYWCTPETADGTMARWPRAPGDRTHPAGLSWRYGEFQAYLRKREKEINDGA